MSKQLFLFVLLAATSSVGCEVGVVRFAIPPIDEDSLTKDTIPDGEWSVIRHNKAFETNEQIGRLFMKRLPDGRKLLLFRWSTPTGPEEYVSAVASIAEMDGVLLAFLDGIEMQQNDRSSKSISFQTVLRASRIDGSDKLLVSFITSDLSTVRDLLQQSKISYAVEKNTIRITDSQECMLTWLWANEAQLFPTNGPKTVIEPVSRSE